MLIIYNSNKANKYMHCAGAQVFLLKWQLSVGAPVDA